MTMRHWRDRLYLGAMPGKRELGKPEGDFTLWTDKMAEELITNVVCLVPEERIKQESPRYYKWRKQLRGTWPLELIDIPIPDMGIPDVFVRKRFWSEAGKIPALSEKGAGYFIHCSAGVGRTGMFAVAILLKMGYELEAALSEVRSVGSGPENDLQLQFLRDRTGDADA